METDFDSIQFRGLEVIESPWLTVVGEPRFERISWRRRLLSWPWRPWRSRELVSPTIPDPHLYQIDGKIVGHPATVRALKDYLPEPR